MGVMLLAALMLLQATAVEAEISEATATCIDCHQELMPGLTGEWRASRHYGADVGCYECHKADPADTDTFEHNGYHVAIIVSPKDCSSCHEREFVEFEKSHHADAGGILGSLDNTLGEVVESRSQETAHHVKRGVAQDALE